MINEILASTTSTDSEYIELYGTPGAPLAGLSLIAVEGDVTGPPGSIDFRFDFASDAVLGENGFYLLANGTAVTIYGVTPDVSISADSLENNSATYALVQTSSIPASGLDGITVLDGLASTDGGAGDIFFFGQPVLGPDGAFFPPGWGRVADGVDTDTTADWTMLSFSNASPPNSPTAGTGDEPVEYVPTPIHGVQGGGASRRARRCDGRDRRHRRGWLPGRSQWLLRAGGRFRSGPRIPPPPRGSTSSVAASPSRSATESPCEGPSTSSTG